MRTRWMEHDTVLFSEPRLGRLGKIKQEQSHTIRGFHGKNRQLSQVFDFYASEQLIKRASGGCRFAGLKRLEDVGETTVQPDIADFLQSAAIGHGREIQPEAEIGTA